MEMLERLLSVLEQTPELALIGVGIYLLFKLGTLASWVYALKQVLTLGIKRFFDFRENQLKEVKDAELEKLKKELSEAKEKLNEKTEGLIAHKLQMAIDKEKHKDIMKVVQMFEKGSIDFDTLLLRELMMVIKKDSSYIRQSDMEKAIELLKNHKK